MSLGSHVLEELWRKSDARGWHTHLISIVSLILEARGIPEAESAPGVKATSSASPPPQPKIFYGTVSKSPGVLAAGVAHTLKLDCECTPEVTGPGTLRKTSSMILSSQRCWCSFQEELSPSGIVAPLVYLWHT